jgi:hypothetical protein
LTRRTRFLLKRASGDRSRYPVDRQVPRALKVNESALGPGTEAAIDRARRKSGVSQQTLETSDCGGTMSTPLPSAQRQHRQRVHRPPGRGSDDPVHPQAVVRLKSLHRGCSHRAKSPIRTARPVAGRGKPALQPADCRRTTPRALTAADPQHWLGQSGRIGRGVW